MNQASKEWIRILAKAVNATSGHDRETCTVHARVILEHLSKELGGQRVYVPVPDTSLPGDKVAELVGAGLSIADAARCFKVTPRTIRNYVARGVDAQREASMIGSKK